MCASASDGHCLNCSTALNGQYCGQCGQRASTRLISLWELIRDAFGDLFELDSRLWRTLVPLLARPGRLTREYLEGRRARYMPPFRSYLVLSLLFFLVAFFDPQNDFAIFFEADPAADSAQLSDEQLDDIRSAREEGGAEARRVIDELVKAGAIDESVLEDLESDIPDIAEPGQQAVPPPEAPDRDQATLKFNIADDDDTINCSTRTFNLSTAPGWIQRRLTEERLNHLCDRWEVEGSEGLGRSVLDRVPAALIFLLPVMALVLKILYPLSRRYYVEHLLFFVHFHSFFFLILILMILWLQVTGWIGLAEAIGILPVVAASFYIPVYLFISMRRVYGQGRFLTFLKFSALSVAYAVGFSTMLLGTLVLAAFSV